MKNETANLYTAIVFTIFCFAMGIYMFLSYQQSKTVNENINNQIKRMGEENG